MELVVRELCQGGTLHGTSVNGCGVFTSVNGCGVFTDEFMEVPDFGHTAEMKVLKKTYAGQCKDGYACGLGVLTWPDGSKYYAEYGPDGQSLGPAGRHVRRPYR